MASVVVPVATVLGRLLPALLMLAAVEREVHAQGPKPAPSKGVQEVEVIDLSPPAPARGPVTAPHGAAAPPTSGTSPDPSGAAVETIDLGPDASPAPTGPAAPSPTPSSSFEMRGWTRALAAVQLAPNDLRGQSPLFALPYDRLLGNGQLYLRGRYARGQRFEAVVSGLLSWTGVERDAASGAFDGFNGASTRAAFEGSLREAYVGFFWRRFDLRVGQQRVPWGKSDAFAINDVVNPRDNRDPLLTETEALRLPVMAVRGDVELGPVSLQLHATPFFNPNRFDVWGSNWAVLQPDAPAALRALASQSTALTPGALHDQLQQLVSQAGRPRYDLTEPTVGARLATSFERGDAALYYQYGYAPDPVLHVNPALGAVIAATDPRVPSTVVGPLTDMTAAGQAPLSVTYVRRHHVGVDAQSTAGPFVLKVDGAYEDRTPVLRRDFEGFTSRSLQGVVGAEYQPEEAGRLFLLEASYQRLLDAPDDGSLLGVARDNVTLALLARWTFVRHLELELRGTQGLRPVGTVLRPQIAWKQDAMEVRLGAILLGGEDYSMPWYYRRNTGAYGAFKYAF